MLTETETGTHSITLPSFCGPTPALISLCTQKHSFPSLCVCHSGFLISPAGTAVQASNSSMDLEYSTVLLETIQKKISQNKTENSKPNYKKAGMRRKTVQAFFFPPPEIHAGQKIEKIPNYYCILHLVNCFSSSQG